MRKGIIIKLNKDRATLMTEDCLFCEVKAFHGMYKGMEICFRDIDILKRKNIFISNKYAQVACFVLIVFSSYLFLSFYQENIATYAYVGIDINSKIEMSLNKKGIITKVTGLDKDGIKLAEQLSIEQMDSVNGIKKIITKTIDMGYLNEKNSNEITVYTITDQKGNKDGDILATKLKTAIKEEISSHNIDKVVKAIVSDKETKKKADKAGVPVLKYIKKDVKPAITKDDKYKAFKNNINDKKKIEKREEKKSNENINKKDRPHKNIKTNKKTEIDHKDKKSKHKENKNHENHKNKQDNNTNKKKK